MRIVLLSQIPSLIEHCRALADGIGVTLEVREPHEGGWQGTVLVLLGEDVVSPPALAGVPTVLVAMSQGIDESHVWSLAAKLGADHIAVIPQAAEWLTQKMINAVEPPALPAVTHGIVAGAGGAGASVLACALAMRCASSGVSTVLLDADPLGGGLDLILGCEDIEGLRWSALTASRGRLRPSTLVQALPRTGDLAVLSWDREESHELEDSVFEAVLTASQQAFDLVIVDLPRYAPAEWVRACHGLTVVSTARVRSAVAAASVARRLGQTNRDMRLAVRESGRSGLDPDQLSRAVGLELIGSYRDDADLAELLDRGDGWQRARSNLGRFVEEFLDSDALDVGQGAA